MKTRHMAYALAAALVLAAPALLPSLTVWRSAVAHASATPQSPGGRDESAKGGVCPEKCYAVLVGVEKYDSPKIAPYEGGGYDSFGLYLSLRKAGFDAEHISLLNDMSAYHAPPTRENILSALSRLRGKAPADGILFVSFGGHGVELGGRSYLLPSDAAASESPRLMEETAIRVDLLKALIRATGAGQVVIFLDTHRVEPLRGDGHEDHLLTESFRDSWKFDEAGGGVKAATLFASGVGQRSYSNYLRGFFSEGLAEGLDELPEESTNPLTLEALVSYVRKTVSARALAQTGKQQVPFAVVQGQQAGEFILAKPEYDTARVSNKLGGPAGVEHLGGAISGVGGNSNTAPGPPRNGNSNTAASGNSNAGVEQRGAVKLTDRETKNPIAPRGKVGRRPDRSGWSHGVEGLRALGQPSARFIVGPERAFIAEQHWETIRASNSPEDYRAFAELYPDSPYASAAKLRYRALRSAPAAQLERYANINCPEDAKVGKPIVVIAQLTMDRRAPLAEQLGQKGDDALAIKRDAGQTSWKIDVIVDAAGFTFLNGSNLYTVDLPADKDSGRARFDLQPKPIKGPSQKTRVYISFWYDGAYLGEVSREVTVTAPLKQGAVTDRKGVPLPLSRSVQTNQQPTPSGGGGGIGRLGTNGPLIRRGINSEAAHNNKNSSTSPMPPLPPSPGPSAAKTEDDTLGLDTNREGPDMTVVLRRVNPDQPGKYQVEIISPHYSASYLPEEYDVPADLSRLVKKYYLTVAASGRGVKPVRPSGQEGGAPPQGSDAMLRDLGREMFRRAPQTFKDTFWDLRDRLRKNFKTVAIHYEDDVLPWELMRPFRENPDEELECLGVVFMVSRWHLDKDTQKRLRFSTLGVSEVHAIAPHYNGNDLVRGQEKELKVLSTLPGYVFVRGRVGEVEKLFGDLPSGIIHFAGHGAVGQTPDNIDEYYIKLEDGEMSVEQWRGGIRNGRRNHPLIFFNACSVGETQKVASLVNGWGPAALNAQASGYIGTLWPVSDEGAADFSVSFYQTLLERAAKGDHILVSELLRDTRRLYLTNHDPAFLAYVYFGDPELEIDLGAGK